MKKNPLLEELRKKVPENIKSEIDLSFEIVNRIQEILLMRNLTQRDLAELLGKSEAEVSKWMRGTHNFTCKTLAKIKMALGEPIIEVTGKKAKTEYILIHVSPNVSLPINESIKMPNKSDFAINYNQTSKLMETTSYN